MQGVHPKGSLVGSPRVQVLSICKCCCFGMPIFHAYLAHLWAYKSKDGGEFSLMSISERSSRFDFQMRLVPRSRGSL